MATINNSTDNTLISGTASADSITNIGNNVTISTGDGNDTIFNDHDPMDFSDANVVINAGDGDDAVGNSNSQVTVNLGDGNDSIGSSGSNVRLYGGDGDDTLMFWCTEANDTATSNYLDAGTGNNVIQAWGGYNFTINAGSGNDFMEVTATNSTINAGDGNNNINVYEYYQNGEFVRRVDNVVVNAGSGYDSILALSDKTTINAGAGSDKVWNVGVHNVINLGAGNDFATNDFWAQDGFVIFNGDTGDDILIGGFGDTINGGSGKDTIYSNKDKIFTDGGADNDVIISGHWGPEIIHHDTYTEEAEQLDIANMIHDTSEAAREASNLTIKGGKGDDTIAISSKSLMNVLQYANGDGNDIVYGYTSTDTINITSGKYTTQTSGNDVIIKVGTGSVTLKNTKGVQLNIKGTYDGTSSTTTSSTLTITDDYKSPITIDSGIKNVDASSRTTAVRIAGNSLANSIKGGTGDNILIGGEGDDTLTGGSGSNVFQYASGGGNDIITNYSSNDTIEITDGIYSTQTSGNDIIVNVGSGSINLKNAKGTTLNIAGTTSDKVSVASDAVTYNGHSYKLYTLGKTWDEAKTYCENLGGHLVAINTSDEQSIIESMISDGSKSSYWLGGYKDAAENWHWVTNEAFYYNNWAIGEPNNGEEGEDKIMIFKNPDPKNPAAKFGDWNDLAADCAEGSWPASIYGTSSFGFICEWDTISSSSSSDTDTVTSNVVTLTNSNSSSYTATSSVKIINASSRTKNVKIVGNSLSNSIVGGSGADSLSGSGGADTLNGGTGKDTLTGGDGADVFYYKSGGGKDIITDYTEGSDSIVINGGYVSASSIKGSDVVLKVGSGTLTLKKAKDKEITVTDELGEHIHVYGDDMFITDSDKAKIKAKSKIITIDASSRTTNINISGSSKANTILGGSAKNTLSGGSGNDYLVGGDDNDKLLGGAGADTLISGSGNDTLTGGAGKDVFIYESGNDIITDYKTSQKDEIVLTNGTVDSVSIKGSNVIFTIGDGQLTVKSGKSQTITITDADGNTNSQKYTKSSSYEERNFIDEDYWFAEDNNFATSNSELSDLTSTPLTNTILSDYNNFDITKTVNESNFLNAQDIKIYANKDN